MKERMDALHFIGQSSGWNQSQYDGALRGMLGEIRQDLRAGNIPLNKHARACATPGSGK